MIRPLELHAVEMVCLNMREADRLEVYPIAPHDSPLRLAAETVIAVRNQGRGAVAWHDGRPHGVMAFVERWPGVWDAIAYGTDKWSAVSVSLVRWAHRELRQLQQTGLIQRLEACSRFGNTDVEKFLLRLGAAKEGPPMLLFGKDGAAYQRFVWLKETRANVLVRQDAGSGSPTDTTHSTRCDIRRAREESRSGG